MKRFCEGSDQDFYKRNHLLFLKQNSKDSLFCYNLDTKSITVKNKEASALLKRSKGDKN